jgi:hypothetical protein
MTKRGNFDQLIEAAVNYWANMFKDTPYGDKANGGQMFGFESILMTFAKMSSNDACTVTDEKITTFKKLFTKHLQEYADRKQDCTISTDWAPEYPLSDFLRGAELTNTFFPSKTMMWVSFSKGTVTVEEDQIYPAVEEKVA